jgi:hypothetical protein
MWEPTPHINSLADNQSRFMGQLTVARFRGDTAFGLISRILSTFAGGLIGMVMWLYLSLYPQTVLFADYLCAFFRYIASGSGSGNPYSLAVVCGICYPFFFYVRIYWPGPFMINMVFFFTVNLVRLMIFLNCEPMALQYTAGSWLFLARQSYPFPRQSGIRI